MSGIIRRVSAVALLLLVSVLALFVWQLTSSFEEMEKRLPEAVNEYLSHVVVSGIFAAQKPALRYT